MTKDQALGAILGGVVGDALGTTLEFSHKIQHDRSLWHTEITGGGPFNMPAGGWTDDTSMMLGLMDTYLKKGFLDVEHLMKNFVAWYQDGDFSHTGGCFDIGNATLDALTRYQRSGNPIAGSTDPFSSGNGGIMRLSPAVVANHQFEEQALNDAVRQSETTHRSLECLLYAKAMAKILFYGDIEVEQDSEVQHLPSSTPWKEVLSGGYVKETYQCAVWAIQNTDTFEEALIHTVNRGYDADTTGAVVGQMAGAIYGLSAIPDRWLDKVLWKNQILNQASRLFDQSGPAVSK